jgi:phosphatidylglycerophosphate synthase
MLDIAARRLIDPTLNYFASFFAKHGVSANTVTLIGFSFGVLSWIFLSIKLYAIALGLIYANRIFDGIDGLIAQKTISTVIGGYLDIVLDFIFYSGVPFFFLIGQPETALPASFLIFSFVGTGSSFLAYGIFAAKHHIKNDKYQNKAIYYLGGLTEGTETIIFFTLICILPEYFSSIAWIFGGLCWITTFTRITQAFLNLKHLENN